MSRIRKIQIGAVSYLNTKPLVYGLAERLPQADLTFDLPSRLADRLASGELDVALIPSIEFFQNPTYSIISDACIGCRGPVLSVKVLFRTPPADVRTLALDEGSRTSAALAKILLRERYGLDPIKQPFPLGMSLEETTADAVLMIGDRAIHPPQGDFVEIWDLGDEWCRWSELSFVFAMWVARAGVALPGLEVALSEARDAGVAHLPEIAAAEAAHVDLTPAQVLSYFRDNLHFHLGQREQRGLELYYRHAAQLNLAPQGLDLQYHDCRTH
ncbi:MAG TPA: menaquinone biosynthesis protein [Pirellulaceae bacterium]|nr:menaquinone biosynthesis protein [Pirellulaceae bacterium]